MHQRVCKLLVLAALASSSAGCLKQTPATPQEIASAVVSHSDWVTDAHRCSIDFMDRAEISALPEGRFCSSSKLEKCLGRCVSGQGPSCYWLGQNLQSAKADDTAVEALFQRSCKLGVGSGCTNRAASILVDKNGDRTLESCALRTFERTCAFDDPWGCTMFALELTRSSESEQDRARALAALEKSCRYGSDDPACTAAKQLTEQLQSRAGK